MKTFLIVILLLLSGCSVYIGSYDHIVINACNNEIELNLLDNLKLNDSYE